MSSSKGQKICSEKWPRCAHTQKCTFTKRKGRKRPRGRRKKKKKSPEEERERDKAPHLWQRQLCDPPVMLPSFVYHEKIPLMPQPHQTADQVHEWHLSEPRVNPMIRGNSPKGLCSWEKCLLQRGMQKIPGSTGPPLLAVWRYFGANKGTKMGS